ncbi:YdcH family protein [Paracoccus fontiphilus]|uniref:YdcH family protein n=2 Tax=Paracoccus fontiphilus TaxID=1815556 RepID=A0ABV7IEB9_9RHOB
MERADLEDFMAAPHAIHEEFPQDSARIHDLKVKDAHFARLLDDYDQVNDAVNQAESLIKPTSEAAEKELRRKRAQLKDEIARMLAAHSVGG